MKALITGGAGFIGSTLADALLEGGDQVAVIDDLSSGSKSNLQAATDRGAELTVADVRTAGAVAGLTQDTGVDVIFHLAAQIDARRAVREPVLDADVNVLGSIQVLEAARAVGARVVLASSVAVYGEPAELPLTEKAPCRPMTAYGQSKLSAEGYVSLYSRLHRLSGIALRLSNVYGARQDALGEAGVVAIFCDRLRRGERPVVFGDGLQTRDFVHVDDVVQAMIAAGRSDGAGVHNVGTGSETSVIDLARILEEIAGGSGAGPEVQEARPGDVRRMAVDSASASSALGWRPAVDLRTGLERTYAALE